MVISRKKVTLLNLRDKILTRSARISIIGLGYVGLPLSLQFSDSGFTVTGIDINPRKVDMLRGGRSYVLDVPDSQVEAAVKDRRFFPSTDFGLLSEVDAISICVPTL